MSASKPKLKHPAPTYEDGIAKGWELAIKAVREHVRICVEEAGVTKEMAHPLLVVAACLETDGPPVIIEGDGEEEAS